MATKPIRGRPMLPPRNKLGAFCRQRRLELGIESVREAEARSGLSYSELAAIERGERSDMALSTVLRLSQLLGVNWKLLAALIFEELCDKRGLTPPKGGYAMEMLRLLEEPGSTIPH